MKIIYGICKCGCSKEEAAIYSKGYKQFCYWRINRENSKLKRDQREPGDEGTKTKAPKKKRIQTKGDPPELIKNKRELRDKKLKYHGYRFCDECKMSNHSRYEFHHIIYRSEKPNHPRLHDKINLIDCCDECHDKFHQIKASRNNLVLERGLNDVFGQDVLKG